jgi:3-oxoacyl-[acyl-carrier protein] reductase
MSETKEDAVSDTGRVNAKVIVVTGAGSGLGRGMVERFVAEGANVVAADIQGDQVRETCAALGDQALPVEVDVADPAAVEAMVATAVDRFGRLDVMCSNAGVAQAGEPIEELSPERFAQVISINLTGAFLCARSAVGHLRAVGGGSIIITGSMAASRPRPGSAAYVASKAGVIGLARQLAIELAPDNIRVNALNPGPAFTGLAAQFGFTDDEKGRQQMRDLVPLGVNIEPEDIAAAALYLASDEAAKVTGLVMNVDGGRDL